VSPQRDSSLSHADLLETVAGVLSHSLGSNLLAWKKKPGKKSYEDGDTRRADWKWLVFLPVVVVLSFIFYFKTNPWLCWLGVWNVGFLVLAMPIAYQIKQSIFQILENDVLPAMSKTSCEQAKDRMNTDYRPAVLWWWTIAISLIWMVITTCALSEDLRVRNPQEFLPIVLWWLSALGFVAAAKVGCSCTFYYAICAACTVDDLEDFPFAPAESPLVRGMARVGLNLVGFMTFTALYLATILIWLHHFRNFVFCNLIIYFVCSLGLGLLIYARVSSKLGELVFRRRQRSLRELQAKLWDTMGDRDKFSSANDLFKTILEQRPNVGVAAMLAGVLPLLIQIGPLILSIPKEIKPSTKASISAVSSPAPASGQRDAARKP
jgi:hypothetical protein